MEKSVFLKQTLIGGKDKGAAAGRAQNGHAGLQSGGKNQAGGRIQNSGRIQNWESSPAGFSEEGNLPGQQTDVTLQAMGILLQKRGLLKALAGRPLDGDAVIEKITCDSREAEPGTLFICKGAAFRESYLREAAAKGAIAYLGEKPIETEQKLTGLIVTDIRETMAVASALFYRYVPGTPKLTGITGTKGKTTTAWYLKAMLDAREREKGGTETGLISTVQNYDGAGREDSVMTTPEAPEVHRHLSNAAACGLPYMTMEVSSQALKYKRVRELQFQVGIFLNISEDHISPQEHVDFEDYFSSKLSIFRQTETAIVNLDSEHSGRILKAARKAKRVITFGHSVKADLRISNVRMEGGRVWFRAACSDFTAQFSLAMHGSFNVENAAAAIAAAHAYGVPVSCMQRALAATSLPGRMENFTSRDKKICAIVDFAHNRLSFEKLYDAVYAEFAGYKRIITVFGCPGGKAYNRRRELGILAGLFSDRIFVTSDDPGTESQEEIAREIHSYIDLTGCPCREVAEREKAVELAVEEAAREEEKTLILVLGRGSEKYQRLGEAIQKYPQDSELVKKALAWYDET